MSLCGVIHTSEQGRKEGMKDSALTDKDRASFEVMGFFVKKNHSIS